MHRIIFTTITYQASPKDSACGMSWLREAVPVWLTRVFDVVLMSGLGRGKSDFSTLEQFRPVKKRDRPEQPFDEKIFTTTAVLSSTQLGDTYRPLSAEERTYKKVRHLNSQPAWIIRPGLSRLQRPIGSLLLWYQNRTWQRLVSTTERYPKELTPNRKSPSLQTSNRPTENHRHKGINEQQSWRMKSKLPRWAHGES